ncbi:hypothetical protein DVH24_035392 [Malus domestica]|uniref:Helicase C-terminal domain-containing protein n=1 Tax=Malus domestica TaxID=3750 RepID=A0A498J4U0_MALDO|nr:hypothetical protein DVH24_035392 [Malus domestica]
MHGVLVADDAAARGLDIPGVRTVVHFQLPHSAEANIWMLCTVFVAALTFSDWRITFIEKSKKNWFQRNAELVELVIDLDDGEEERVKSQRKPAP